MPRDMRAGEKARRAKARREGALARAELREPSSPRESAAGATSFPVKKVDDDTAAKIRDFLAAKGTTV